MSEGKYWKARDVWRNMQDADRGGMGGSAAGDTKDADTSRYIQGVIIMTLDGFLLVHNRKKPFGAFFVDSGCD